MQRENRCIPFGVAPFVSGNVHDAFARACMLHETKHENVARVRLQCVQMCVVRLRRCLAFSPAHTAVDAHILLK